MENPQSIARLVAPWLDSRELQIERKAVYRFHARCCDSFSKGRVFLVGDAAHITPPFVGQGLVAGLRDVANLAWKLAWVVRGKASTTILDSYDQERCPHAKAMIDMAKLMGRLVMPKSKSAALLIHGMMRVLALAPVTRRYFEELQIKPRNVFRSGLFIPHRRGDKLIRGGPFPQAWVRNAQRQIQLSDEVLGDHLTLLGFGVDPLSLLPPEQVRAWTELGGSFLQIAACGQHPDGKARYVEDLDHQLLPLAAKGTLAAVRPDRQIMHHLPGTQAANLVRTCIDLMGRGNSTAGSVSITIGEPQRMRA